MRHFLILVLGLLISGCGSQTSRYEITNSSSSTLENVRLSIGDDERVHDDIIPGKTLSFRTVPLAEEEAVLTFIQDGEHKSVALCYQTFLLGARNVVIVKNGNIERRCEA